MELLKLFLKEHRGVIVAAAAVLALIVAFSTARCTMVQSERALEEITKQTDDLGGTGSTPVGGADEDGKDGGQSDTEKALAKLTEEQRQRQDSYDEETAAFVSELSSNIWTARNDAYFLTFTGATFTDTAKGEATVHPYVINNLTPRPSTSENGRTVEVTEAAIETDEGIFVLTYTVTTVNETGEVTAKVASGAFSVIEQDGYTRTAATDGSLTVTGLNDDYEKLIDSDVEGLEDALRDFCSLNVPTATEAAWCGVAEQNWEEQTVTTWFDLDNSGHSSVEVIYDTRTEQFSIENSYGVH